MRRWAILAVALVAVACGVNLRDFAIEGVGSINRLSEELVEMELRVSSDSHEELRIESGEIEVRMKGEPLVGFLLDSVVVIPPGQSAVVRSRWRVRRDDVATLFAMRNRPIERYLDRITIDYRVGIESDGHKRQLSRRGVKGSKLNIGEF